MATPFRDAVYNCSQTRKWFSGSEGPFLVNLATHVVCGATSEEELEKFRYCFARLCSFLVKYLGGEAGDHKILEKSPQEEIDAGAPAYYCCDEMPIVFWRIVLRINRMCPHILGLDKAGCKNSMPVVVKPGSWAKTQK
jgi:hypothetical protein